MYRLWFICLTLLIFVPLAHSNNTYETGNFLLINKITTAKKILIIPIKKTKEEQNLSVKFYNCFLTQDKGFAALVELSIHQKLIFKGWLFSASSSLNAVEDPVYDLKILSCDKKAQL